MSRHVSMLLLLVACARTHDEGDDRKLMALDPILARLQQPAERVILTLGDDPAALKIITDACTGNDDVLNDLAAMHLDAWYEHDGTTPVPDLSRNLVTERSLYCGPERDRGAAICARWCEVGWTRLVLGVEHLRLMLQKRSLSLTSIAP